jgi:peptidoglycan/xylan/chitin deacetylase (PgdA/CDA1 family)
VNDDQDPFFGGVPIKIFAQQMEMLSRHFNVLPLEELIERARRGDVPANAVALTFDDGYQDNYENAFPILKQFGLPATIFLATGAVDSRTPLWHDLIFNAFRRTKVDSFSLEGKSYPLRTLVERCLALDAFRRHFIDHLSQNRDDLIQQLYIQLRISEQLCSSMEKLSWREIEEMANSKITFGAHTVSHPILTRIPLAEAVNEIIASKKAIEYHLKSPVLLFAYPNGRSDDFNESIKTVLRESGFIGAVTTIWGVNNIHTDFFELRRLSMWGLDSRMCALKLGWYKFAS